VSFFPPWKRSGKRGIGWGWFSIVKKQNAIVHNVTTNRSLRFMYTKSKVEEIQKFSLYYFIVLYRFRSTHNELEKNR
jgi:hypothetical protein